MSTLTLLNANLGNTFAPSAAFLISAERVSLFFDLTVTAPGPASIEWYTEFSDGATGGSASSWTWRRETAEEDTGNGVVNMPKVVRTFQENGTATGLAAGVHNLSAQLVRTGPFCRIQMRAASGTVAAVVSTPFGAQAP